MPSVQYDSPNNSTHFTTCCNVAVLPYEQRCPRCESFVYPFTDGMTPDERDREMTFCERSRHAEATHRAWWRRK